MGHDGRLCRVRELRRVRWHGQPADHLRRQQQGHLRSCQDGSGVRRIRGIPQLVQVQGHSSISLESHALKTLIAWHNYVVDYSFLTGMIYFAENRVYLTIFSTGW